MSDLPDVKSMTDEELLINLRIEVRKLVDAIKLRDELLFQAERIIAAAQDGVFDINEPGWVLGAMSFRDRYEAMKHE